MSKEPSWDRPNGASVWSDRDHIQSVGSSCVTSPVCQRLVRPRNLRSDHVLWCQLRSVASWDGNQRKDTRPSQHSIHNHNHNHALQGSLWVVTVLLVDWDSLPRHAIATDDSPSSPEMRTGPTGYLTWLRKNCEPQ